MKTLFLSAAAVAALTLSAPASAQLLGGGGLTGGLGGQIGGTLGGTLGRPGSTLDRPVGRTLERVPLDRLDAPVEQTTRATKRARSSAEVERSIDRRSGKASASGRADGGVAGAVDSQAGALGRSAGLSGGGNASGSASGGASADLIGTDEVRGTARNLRDRADNGVTTARSAVDRARGTLGNAANGVGGSLSGSGSGSGSASGSAGGDGAYGSAEGSGAATATGNVASALEPGARVEDARGRLVGKLKQVNRNARGRIESLDVQVGRRVATLPAGNFSASGDVLVSAMSKGEVKDAAEDGDD